jgi:pimeloyl-ACP methyl ester carboxylesterase
MQSQEFNFDSLRLPLVDVSRSSGLVVVERGDVRIACDYEPPVSDAPADQLLILINGFARPRADFRAFRKRIHAQMPHLATVALDNRGAGETEGGIGDLTVQNMALDAAFVAQGFAAALQLRGYHALGISMGGMIAQTWAAQDARVNSLTLVSTTAGGQARVWPEGVNGEEARRKPFEPWPQDAAVMHRRMSRYFGPKFRAASPMLIDIMVKNMLKSHTVESAQGRAKAQYNATVGFDGTALAAQVTCPTLVLTGTHDEVIPAENSSEIQKLIPHAKLFSFADMGHLLLIEDPENFVAQVRTFLERVGR